VPPLRLLRPLSGAQGAAHPPGRGRWGGRVVRPRPAFRSRAGVLRPAVVRVGAGVFGFDRIPAPRRRWWL